MPDISRYEVREGETWGKKVLKPLAEIEAKEDEPDYETQLAINVYKRLKSGLGFGTLLGLERIIELIPLTKRTSQVEIRGIDVLDGDD